LPGTETGEIAIAIFWISGDFSIRKPSNNIMRVNVPGKPEN
jgi:hypothetical protein